MKNTFIIPFRSNNLIEKMILKYNKNLEEIERLSALEEEDKELSFIEKVFRETKENHNNALLRMMGIVK